MAKVHPLASLSTSYDLAFLHEVLAGLGKAPVRSLPCTALPWRKVKVRELSSPGQQWLAAVNVLLMEAKCRDDLADEGRWKGLLGLTVLSPKLQWAREVMRETGFACETITELPLRQAQAEAADHPTLEGLALPTSMMLGEVFAHLACLAEQPEKAAALRHLGQGLGTAIYLKDARDDLKKDRKRGCFNGIVASGLGDHATSYVDTALRREVRRAQHGLAALRLDGETPGLQQILASFTVPEKASAISGPVARIRRRRAIAGDCDCGICACCCEAAASPGAECCCHGCSGCDCCAVCNTGGSDSGKAPPAAPPQPKLLCPACGNTMSVYAHNGVEIDECGTCCGLWFDHQELEALASMTDLPERLYRRRPNPPQTRPRGTRPCPRCARTLTVTPIQGVQVDLCAGCKGMFLDQGDLNTLLDGI